MHSGADVEAFTAALNKDIEGDSSSPQASDCASSSVFPMWQQSNQDVNSNDQSLHGFKNLKHQVQSSSELNMKGYPSSTESQQLMANAPNTQSELLLQHKQAQRKNQERKVEQHLHSYQSSQSSRMPISGQGSCQIHEPGKMHNPSSEAWFSNVPKFESQPASVPEQASNPVNRGRQIPFGSLLPLIVPELDKDRAMQLRTLYGKLKKNEITKEGFVRLMRGIVGDHMLKVAVVKMQAKLARESQSGPNQVYLQPQNQMQRQPLRPPASMASHTNDPYTIAHLHQRSQNSPVDPARSHCSTMLVHKDSSHQIVENSSHSLQGLSKLQQQHLHFPPTSLPMYGTSSYHPHVGSNVSASSAMAKAQPHDPLPRHSQIPQSFGPSNLGSAIQPMGVIGASHLERQNSFNDIKRVPSGSISQVPSGSVEQQGLHRQPSSEELKIGAMSSVPYVKQESSDQANEQQHRSLFSSSHGPASFGVPQLEQGSSGPGTLNKEPVERHQSKLALELTTTAASNNLGPCASTAPSNADIQNGPQVPSPSPTVTAGNNIKTPVKKPSAGQKKPLDSAGSSPPLPSKKQKVSGNLADQSIEQLNDVTAVSGVNLREEEEQLFSMPIDDTRASEASRKVVQEEEEKLLLQKLPLQKKLAEIMTKCGLKNLSNDVERCLSLCVEERLRGLLSSMIRISRQRVDSEKSRHRTVGTSDVRQQILAINQKAKEEWEKKQAEADKLRKLNEPDTGTGAEGEKEKEENRAKSLKANKEDEKMRTTAANVAARAAVGGDDMLSKWQLMAEQARQKREGGGADVASNSDVTRKPLLTNLKSQGLAKSDQLNCKRSGALRSRNQPISSRPGVARNISLRDVISVLEREPQTTKSTTLYCLYERVHATDSPSSEPAKGVSQSA